MLRMTRSGFQRQPAKRLPEGCIAPAAHLPRQGLAARRGEVPHEDAHLLPARRGIGRAPGRLRGWKRPMHWRIELLGRLRIAREGQDVTPFLTQKVASLL